MLRKASKAALSMELAKLGVAVYENGLILPPLLMRWLFFKRWLLNAKHSQILQNQYLNSC